MDSNKKLEFVHKMAKLGLHHYDGGGVISAGNSNPLEGITGALTPQNTFTATGPNAAAVTQNQNQLAGVLSNEATGAGPNPAQMQYEQNAEKTAQQQAQLNAQNRAINPGEAARLSGNEAVQAQGNAAAGAAGQQAQQQLAAQGQLSQLYAQQQNAANNVQGLNAQVSQNNTNAVANTQGGLLSSIPLIGGLFGGSKGGRVPEDLEPIKMAGGGSISSPGVPNFSNANDLPDTQMKSAAPKADDPFSGMEADNFGASNLELPGLGDSAGFSSSAGAPSLMGAAPAAAEGGGSMLGIPSLAEAAPLALAKGGEVGPKSFAGKYLNSKVELCGGGMYAKGGKLDANARKHIAPHNFAGPDKSYPIEDASHARNALARVSQHGSPSLQKQVRAKVHEKYPSIGKMAKGGEVPAMVSPGEITLDPKQAKAVAAGKADPMKVGQKIHGHAKVKGDSLKNDIVPKMLKDGGMVIPRSVVRMHPDKAAAFVRNHLSKKGLRVA